MCAAPHLLPGVWSVPNRVCPASLLAKIGLKWGDYHGTQSLAFMIGDSRFLCIGNVIHTRMTKVFSHYGSILPFNLYRALNHSLPSLSEIGVAKITTPASLTSRPAQ